MTLHGGDIRETWGTMSLEEQLGNIGSEVHRIVLWKNKDVKQAQRAFERALELYDFSIADTRWKKGLKELTRGREILCDTFVGTNQYHDSLERLDKYFLAFALSARKNK